MDEKVEARNAFGLGFGNPFGPIFQTLIIRRMTLVAAESHQNMGSCDLHVERIPSTRRIADDGAYIKFGQTMPVLLISKEPIRMPELHSQRQFPGPFFEVRPKCIGMLWRKMGR